MTANQEIIAELRRVLKERDDAQARVIDAALIHADLVRERDEARAELAGLPAWQKGCEQALADLADAEEAIARLYTERDEARAELATLRKDYDSVLEANVGLLDDAPWADVRRSYRRGAEDMRLACQQWCRAWENNGEAIADALADLRVGEP